MQHVSDATLDALVGPDEAMAALRDAFAQFAEGAAAMQPRVRTEAAGVKLSTLGAVLPGSNAVGAKVYTTVAGRFSFVIILFAADSGAPLATFDAAAITRLRTAACSAIAAQHLARRGARSLAVLGLGVQGRAHARQFARAFDLREIRVQGPHLTDDDARALQADTGVAVRRCAAAAEAVDGADLVVTASRAATPLFDGAGLARGAFVAAVGSSLPGTRELDDTALARAAIVAVEWREQALREAGDLVLAAPAALPPGKVVELGELVSGRAPGRTDEDQLTIYKSVGVGLEDVAVAALAWRKLNALGAGKAPAQGAAR
ncbi:MAG: ornithine cyclodeaminase family protein [Rubrivivax sp.]|nr:ornithine cyclodeaminase family protein [Rubrivivax sp.]